MSFIPCIIESQAPRSKGQRMQFHVGLIPVGQVPPEQRSIVPTLSKESEITQIQAFFPVFHITHCVETLGEAVRFVSVLQNLDMVEVDRRDASVVRRSFKRASFAQVAWDMDIDIQPRLPRQRRRPYLADRREQRV